MRYLYLIALIVFCWSSPVFAQIDRTVNLYTAGSLAVLKPGCVTHDMPAGQQVRGVKPRSGRRASICKPIPLAAFAADSVGLYTTVSSNCRIVSFNISDEETGEPVPGATITFTSREGKDSLRFFADERGHVQTSALSFLKEYTMQITSIGYKNHYRSLQLNSDTVIWVKLSREIKENADVVVVSGKHIRCIYRTYCSAYVSVCDLKRDSSVITSRQASFARLYPNPVRRGAMVKVETAFTADAMVQVRVTNLTGATLSTMSYKPVKGLNRIEIPIASHWSAGVYVVQMVGETARLLQSQKIIIQ